MDSSDPIHDDLPYCNVTNLDRMASACRTTNSNSQRSRLLMSVQARATYDFGIRFTTEMKRTRREGGGCVRGKLQDLPLESDEAERRECFEKAWAQKEGAGSPA